MAEIRSTTQVADVRNWGAVSGQNSTIQIQQAIDDTGAADQELWFPDGEWVADNLTLTGRAQLRGRGDVSILRQSTGATGAFLNLFQPSTYTGTRAARNRRTVMSSLRISGNGSTDVSNIGLHCEGAGGLMFADLSFEDFGGECIWLDASSTDGSKQIVLNEFHRIVLVRPVDAHLTGSPYLRMTGIVNGNDFNRIGFRSLTTDDDGPAVVICEAGDFTGGRRVPDTNKFQAWWTEFLHTPDGGTVFDISMIRSMFEMPQWFDHGAQPTAGTSWIRLSDDATTSFDETGGNWLYGWIPANSNAAGSYEVGVDVFQSRNRIDGIKGFRQANVRLNPGVEHTSVHLEGQESDVLVTASTDVGIIDNSGSETNTLIDVSGRGGMFQLPSHVQLGTFDTGGTLRTLAQPTGAGPATWV